ncbi:MAG TPA: hypothetical protein VF543_02660 [Pyrinomonadaceae bacterium]
MNDTLFALIKHIGSHSSALPASWFRPDPPEIEEERLRLRKLAMLILRRRIADLFRRRAPLVNLSAIEDSVQDIADPHAPSPERQILLVRILEVTRSILDEIKPEDRDLIALIAKDNNLREKLKPRERQRLHRARVKLRDEIARRLGVDVSELLRNNP